MSENSEPQKVEIVGIRVPFLDLVTILVKMALAAIPAAILVGFFIAMWVAFLGHSLK